MSSHPSHTPVMYEELLGSLTIFPRGWNVIIDCTLGLAWHASWVIEKLWKGDIFICLDCDEINLTSARENLLSVLNSRPIEEQPIIYCISSNFSEMRSVIENIWNYSPINQLNRLNKLNWLTCVYADLGVSSVHFDTPERGFSFRFDGPLDMRLDTNNEITAAKLVNTLPYEKMAEIFRIYGDESRAGFIAKKIIEAREIKPFETTKQLADVVTKAWKDSLPRIFQALRIAVNNEYGALEKMLCEAHDLLVPGGWISIISFHSGEDRIVKNFFRDKSRGEIDPITGHETTKWTLEVLTKKPLTPTEEEIEKNPRSRSALLRVARKI